MAQPEAAARAPSQPLSRRPTQRDVMTSASDVEYRRWKCARPQSPRPRPAPLVSRLRAGALACALPRGDHRWWRGWRQGRRSSARDRAWTRRAASRTDSLALGRPSRVVRATLTGALRGGAAGRSFRCSTTGSRTTTGAAAANARSALLSHTALGVCGRGLRPARRACSAPAPRRAARRPSERQSARALASGRQPTPPLPPTLPAPARAQPVAVAELPVGARAGRQPQVQAAPARLLRGAD